MTAEQKKKNTAGEASHHPVGLIFFLLFFMPLTRQVIIPFG